MSVGTFKTPNGPITQQVTIVASREGDHIGGIASWADSKFSYSVMMSMDNGSFTFGTVSVTSNLGGGHNSEFEKKISGNQPIKDYLKECFQKVTAELK